MPEVLVGEDHTVSERLEVREVSRGIEDHSPAEGSVSSETGASEDRAVQLVRLYIAFVNEMKATRPEILRGVRVWQLLRCLPWAWLRGQLDDLHLLSQETANLDQFWSHSWQGAGWAKLTNILYLHSCLPASIAGTLSAGVAFGLVSAGLLGALQTWCMLFAFVAFCITLLLWRPRKLVFLDIACIHQTDEERKGEAILSMGAFLKQSNSMLILWDPTWVTRLRPGCSCQLLPPDSIFALNGKSYVPRSEIAQTRRQTGPTNLELAVSPAPVNQGGASSKLLPFYTAIGPMARQVSSLFLLYWGQRFWEVRC